MKSIAEKNFKTQLKFVYSDNNTLSVIFHDNDLLMGVVGEFNKNLKNKIEHVTQNILFGKIEKNNMRAA